MPEIASVAIAIHLTLARYTIYSCIDHQGLIVTFVEPVIVVVTGWVEPALPMEFAAYLLGVDNTRQPCASSLGLLLLISPSPIVLCPHLQFSTYAVMWVCAHLCLWSAQPQGVREPRCIAQNDSSSSRRVVQRLYILIVLLTLDQAWLIHLLKYLCIGGHWIKKECKNAMKRVLCLTCGTNGCAPQISSPSIFLHWHDANCVSSHVVFFNEFLWRSWRHRARITTEAVVEA